MSQNRCNPLICLWFITETSIMVVISNTSCKKCILWARDIKLMCFYLLLYQLLGRKIFFEFLVSVINHYHINGLLLFCDSFEWFCLQISCDIIFFPLLSKTLRSRINSCYSILFSSLKQKKNTLLLVELLTVT